MLSGPMTQNTWRPLSKSKCHRSRPENRGKTRDYGQPEVPISRVLACLREPVRGGPTRDFEPPLHPDIAVIFLVGRGSLLYEASVREGRGAPPAGWRRLGSYLRSHWLPRRSMLTGLGRAASNSVRGETDLPVSFLQKLSRVALVCALLVWPIRSVFSPTRTGGACRRRAKTLEAA